MYQIKIQSGWMHLQQTRRESNDKLDKIRDEINVLIELRTRFNRNDKHSIKTHSTVF